MGPSQSRYRIGTLRNADMARLNGAMTVFLGIVSSRAS